MTNSQSLVDIKFATAQLGGNTELLHRMLGKFKDEFASVPAKVSSLIEQNDLKEAKLKVHTTKGLSGNLGLMALFECSKLLDQQIREDQIQAEVIEEFSSIMKGTCEFIDNLETAPENIAEYTTSNGNQDKELQTEFLERLKRNEFIDDDTLHQYVNNLSLDSEEKKALKTLVEELQYSGAIAMLEKLK